MNQETITTYEADEATGEIYKVERTPVRFPQEISLFTSLRFDGLDYRIDRIETCGDRITVRARGQV